MERSRNDDFIMDEVGFYYSEDPGVENCNFLRGIRCCDRIFLVSCIFRALMLRCSNGIFLALGIHGTNEIQLTGSMGDVRWRSCVPKHSVIDLYNPWLTYGIFSSG